MSKENYGIRWANFTLTDADSWFPVFGKWCGPGYSAGKRTKIMGKHDAEVSPVVYPSTRSVSPIDRLCKEHDLEYERAKGRPDEAAIKLAADIVLLNALRQLDENALTRGEILYRFAMEYVFNLITLVPRTVLPKHSYTHLTSLTDETKKLMGDIAYTLVAKSARKINELRRVDSYASGNDFAFAFPESKKAMGIKFADFRKDHAEKKSSHSQVEQQAKPPESFPEQAFPKTLKFSEEEALRAKSRNYV